MTLERTKIALFASILLLPIIASSAYADGSAEIVAVCGFTAPNDVPLGLIVYGIDSDEVNFSIDVDGNGIGTLDLTASNWVGTENNGAHASQLLTLGESFSSTNTQYEIILPGVGNVEFDAVGGWTSSNIHFDVSSQNPNIIAGELRDLINEHHITGVHVTAIVQNYNEILITYNYPGYAGNNIGYNVGPVGITAEPFSGGTDDFDVLPAETTRYSVTDNGTPSSGTTYAEKTALAPTGQTKILTTEAFRVNPINLSFQLTGVDVLDDVDYLGAITQTWTFTYYCTE